MTSCEADVLGEDFPGGRSLGRGIFLLTCPGACLCCLKETAWISISTLAGANWSGPKKGLRRGRGKGYWWLYLLLSPHSQASINPFPTAFSTPFLPLLAPFCPSLPPSHPCTDLGGARAPVQAAGSQPWSLTSWGGDPAVLDGVQHFAAAIKGLMLLELKFWRCRALLGLGHSCHIFIAQQVWLPLRYEPHHPFSSELITC